MIVVVVDFHTCPKQLTFPEVYSKPKWSCQTTFWWWHFIDILTSTKPFWGMFTINMCFQSQYDMVLTSGINLPRGQIQWPLIVKCRVYVHGGPAIRMKHNEILIIGFCLGTSRKVIDWFGLSICDRLVAGTLLSTKERKPSARVVTWFPAMNHLRVGYRQRMTIWLTNTLLRYDLFFWH